MMYFEKWGHFPSSKLQSLYEKFLNDPKLHVLVDELLNELRKAGEMLENITSQDLLNGAEGDKSASALAIGKSLNYLVARETVKASIGGGITEGGKLAIRAIEQATTRAAAHCGSVAQKVLGSFGDGVSSVVGEYIAGQLAEQFGVQATLHRAVEASALAGMFVGGPIGFVVGAGIGAVTFAVVQTLGALARIGCSPGDNWVYYETHDAHNMCFGSYASDDTMYWKTYCSKYPEPYSEGDCFSAGNCLGGQYNQSSSYYRDLIRASRVNGRLVIIHCRGGLNPQAGSTVITYRS